MAEEISQFNGEVTPKIEDTTSIDIGFTVRYDEIDSFDGEIIVPPENEMNGTTDIMGQGTDSFDGVFDVRYDPTEEFDGLFEVPLFDNVDSFDGILSTRIDTYDLFDAIFTIPPNNVLNGAVDIEETPKRDYYASLLKDTYTLTDDPERNFGGDTKLEFSNESTVLLDFKFSPIDDPFFKAENELDTYLQIYVKKAVHSPTKGYVHLVEEEWSEYFVTENNKPSMTQLVEFDIPENFAGWMEINLGDLLGGLDKTEDIKRSLAVTTDGSEYTLSSSKEGTSSDAPKLLYKYYYVPPNAARIAFDGNMVVRVDDEDSIDVTFTVDSNWFGETINVDLEVPSFDGEDSFDARVTAIQTPNTLPVFDGAISVKRFDALDIGFDAEVIARIEDETTFDSSVSVPLFDTTESFEATVTARQDIEENIDIDFEVPKFEKEDSFEGLVTVRHDREETIDVYFEVPLMNDARAFDGTITVRYDEVEEIDVSMEVPLMEDTDSIDVDLASLAMAEDNFDAYLELPSIVGEDKINVDMYSLSIGEDMFEGILDVTDFERIDHFEGNVTPIILVEDSIDITFTVKTDNENKAYVFIM